jgi:hypothetical protein
MAGLDPAIHDFLGEVRLGCSAQGRAGGERNVKAGSNPGLFVFLTSPRLREEIDAKRRVRGRLIKF